MPANRGGVGLNAANYRGDETLFCREMLELLKVDAAVGRAKSALTAR